MAPTSAFAPGGVDTFTVTAPELGSLTHIRVSHNAMGPHPDWMLEMVRIVHVQSGQEWLYFGHVWLHEGNGNQAVLYPGEFANDHLSSALVQSSGDVAFCLVCSRELVTCTQKTKLLLMHPSLAL